MDFDVRAQQGMDFCWGKKKWIKGHYGLWTHILARKTKYLNLKRLNDGCFLQTPSFLPHMMLTDGLDSCCCVVIFCQLFGLSF